LLHVGTIVGSEIHNIRNPTILWGDSSYHSIMCFFFLVLWKFRDLKTLTIAWTPKEGSQLCGDTKDGVVDKDTLLDKQMDKYVK
jgi:hypothetical protein